MGRKEYLRQMYDALRSGSTPLRAKTVAITGSTGGLGRELCLYFARLGAELVLVDRNAGRSAALRKELLLQFPQLSVKLIQADLADFESVRAATEMLVRERIDIFLHNAGAYSIPRYTCDTGYDNVYQINFVSPYYIIRKLLPQIEERCGRVIVVGSIAHNYSSCDTRSVDFADRKRASLVYGNAKRYLMYSMYELFEGSSASVAVVHPGISFTGITAHYPKLLFALIKHPMKLIFMKPKRAALSILAGAFDSTASYEWIGPRLFGVWGKPKKRGLKTADTQEVRFISDTARRVYEGLCDSTGSD